MLFVWILVPVVLFVAAFAFSRYRNRKPNSLEAGLREFRRGLDALDPANDPLKRSESDPTRESRSNRRR